MIIITKIFNIDILEYIIKNYNRYSTNLILKKTNKYLHQILDNSFILNNNIDINTKIIKIKIFLNLTDNNFYNILYNSNYNLYDIIKCNYNKKIKKYKNPDDIILIIILFYDNYKNYIDIIDKIVNNYVNKLNKKFNNNTNIKSYYYFIKFLYNNQYLLKLKEDLYLYFKLYYIFLNNIDYDIDSVIKKLKYRNFNLEMIIIFYNNNIKTKIINHIYNI